MGLALRLFLLLLLAVALPARAAQGDPLRARGADLVHALDYLEGLLNDTMNVLEKAGAEPVAEGDLASQPTFRIEPLGHGEGVSAGRTSPGPLMAPAHKPSSHRRGPLRMNNKPRGDSKSLEASKQMENMQSDLERRHEMDGEAAEKEAFPSGSSGSLAASAAGTVTGDWDRKLHFLDALLDDALKLLENAGGVSAGRTAPGPLMFPAHNPGSHLRGPPNGKNKARGQKKPHEPLKVMQQMLKEMLQAGQEVAAKKAAFPSGSNGSLPATAAGRVTGDEVAGKASPLDWLNKVLKPLEPPADVFAGRTFPDPLLIPRQKPGSHHREVAAKKTAFPGGSRGSLSASAAGRVTGDWDRKLHFLDALLDDGLKLLENAGGVSAERTAPGPLVIPAHKPSSHRTGPPTGKKKAGGQKKPHEPLKVMRQMLKEMLQAGQEMDGKAA